MDAIPKNTATLNTTFFRWSRDRRIGALVKSASVFHDCTHRHKVNMTGRPADYKLPDYKHRHKVNMTAAALLTTNWQTTNTGTRSSLWKPPCWFQTARLQTQAQGQHYGGRPAEPCTSHCRTTHTGTRSTLRRPPCWTMHLTARLHTQAQGQHDGGRPAEPCTSLPDYTHRHKVNMTAAALLNHARHCQTTNKLCIYSPREQNTINFLFGGNRVSVIKLLVR